MKYSHNYSKLQKNEYTTIRRYPKGKIGKIVLEKYPSGYHYAEIIGIERKSCIQISTPFLLEDTDCLSRHEALDLIQSFYKKPIHYYKEKLYIYHLKKI